MATDVIVCSQENFHPYECGGTSEGCRHCSGSRERGHDPDTCALCHWDDDEWLEKAFEERGRS